MNEIELYRENNNLYIADVPSKIVYRFYRDGSTQGQWWSSWWHNEKVVLDRIRKYSPSSWLEVLVLIGLSKEQVIQMIQDEVKRFLPTDNKDDYWVGFSFGNGEGVINGV